MADKLIINFPSGSISDSSLNIIGDPSTGALSNTTYLGMKSYFQQGISSSTNINTGSFVTTSSFNSFTSSYITDSSSFNNHINSNSSSLSNISASFNILSSSYNNDSSSFNSRINNITGSGGLTNTGSFVTTSSFNNFTSSGNYKSVYNVVNYGADRTGTSDSTVAIQNAINTCDLNGGGTVFFPNGNYKIAGALQTNVSGANNCQIYIPAHSQSSALRTSIDLVGESTNLTPSGYGPVLLGFPSEGAILSSTIVGSGTFPSIIGTKGSGNFESLNYTDINFENLSIRAYTNSGSAPPTLTGINMFSAAKVSMTRVTIGLDIPLQNSVNPSGSECAGAIIGQVSNDGPNNITECNAEGFKYGWVLGEHTQMNNVYAISCYHCYVFQKSNYSVTGKILAHASVNELLFPTSSIMGTSFGTTYVDLYLESEQDTGGFWYDSVSNLVDTGYNGKGRIVFNNAVGSGVSNISFVVNGGVGLELVPSDSPLPVQGIAPQFSLFNNNMVWDRHTNAYYRRDNGPSAQILLFSGSLFYRNWGTGTQGQQATTFTSPFTINSSGLVGVGGVSSPTSFLHIPAPSASISSMRIASGSAPTTPNDGDIWYDHISGSLKMQISGSVKTFVMQ